MKSSPGRCLKDRAPDKLTDIALWSSALCPPVLPSSRCRSPLTSVPGPRGRSYTAASRPPQADSWPGCQPLPGTPCSLPRLGPHLLPLPPPGPPPAPSAAEAPPPHPTPAPRWAGPPGTALPRPGPRPSLSLEGCGLPCPQALPGRPVPSVPQTRVSGESSRNTDYLKSYGTSSRSFDLPGCLPWPKAALGRERSPLERRLTTSNTANTS